MSLISTVGFEDLSNNWVGGSVHFVYSSWFAGNGFISRTELRHVMMNLGEVLTEEECASMVEVSSNSCNPATNRSQFIKMSSRRDICSKFYTTGFSGLKFDTVKVPNLRHCVLKDLTELILSFFIRESFSVLVQIGVFSWFRITFEYSSQNSVRQ